jgi:hypothetical protein
MPISLPVPLWLLWTRAIFVAISVAGIAVHYNLRLRGRRKVRHAVARFFVHAARENRLGRVRMAASIVESGMKKVYGPRPLRIILISLSLSMIYLLVAFLVSGGVTYDWRHAYTSKARLEWAADRVLYATPVLERERATSQACMPAGQGGFVCKDRFTDPQASATRARLGAFPARYRDLVSRSPDRAAVTMLTLWQGTYVDNAADRLIARLSLVGLNVLVDLAGVLLVFQALRRLSESASLLSMIGLAAIVLSLSGTLVFGTIYAYQLVANGDEMGIAAILGFLLSLASLLFALVVFLGTWLEAHETNDEDKKRPKMWTGVLVGAAALSFTIGIAILWMPHIVSVSISTPASALNKPLEAFFGLVALGSIFPTLVGTVCIVVLVVAGAFARVLLFPTLIYLRTALRMPGPLMVTLTAAPAVVAQAMVSTWSELCRMLGIG